MPLNVDTEMKEYDSGFTAVCLYVKYPLDATQSKTAMGEIQIIGAHVRELAAAEHHVYRTYVRTHVRTYVRMYVRHVRT